MSVILNNTSYAANFCNAIEQLTKDAHRLWIGVSYVRKSGWDILRKYISKIPPNQVRLVCTFQMNVTQPAAIRQAFKEGVDIQIFDKQTPTYHPKVFLAFKDNKPTRYLVGSANISRSALTTSIEAGILGDEKEHLDTLVKWFDDFSRTQSVPLTLDLLKIIEKQWQDAVPHRIQKRFDIRRSSLGSAPPKVEAEDIEAIEDIFSTLQLPLGLLNFDYARNNIRNVGRLREVLLNWENVKRGITAANDKQRSELKLLGFAKKDHLTPLGNAALNSESDEAVAILWCQWLQQTDENLLEKINPRLLIAKRVFSQFWRLNTEIRDYFLLHSQNPRAEERKLLQVIELLCNSSGLVEKLSLEDIRTLAALLDNLELLPPNIKDEIQEYFVNKGTRSWSSHDRRILPQAWKDALAQS